ncbi:hypothetical protein D3C87_1400420 [compost metagenome]
MFIEDAECLGRVNRPDRCRIRNLQGLACADQVHIVLNERFGIGAPQRHQHLINRGVRHLVALCDGEQVITTLHIHAGSRAPRAAHRSRRHISARAAQRHQNADLYLALPRTGTDVQ